MTPIEKAKNLMQEVYDLDQHNKTTQKRCKEISLLCVNKQLELINTINNDGADDYYEDILQMKEALERM
jgi:hypothetical protein